MCDRKGGMTQTPHDGLVRALAKIDQLVALAEAIPSGQEAMQSILKELRELRATVQAAEVLERNK
jgi:hypothetical protein